MLSSAASRREARPVRRHRVGRGLRDDYKCGEHGPSRVRTARRLIVQYQRINFQRAVARSDDGRWAAYAGAISAGTGGPPSRASAPSPTTAFTEKTLGEAVAPNHGGALAERVECRGLAGLVQSGDSTCPDLGPPVH